MASRMMLKASRINVKLKDVVQQILLGMGIGIVTDAGIEIAKIPVLNDSGTFGNSDISNFELIFYGITISGIVAAIIDIGTGKGVLTFTKSMLFYLIGLIVGVYFYENTLTKIFKIRINPYELVGKYIPPVLPAGTKLPFIPSATTPPAVVATQPSNVSKSIVSNPIPVPPLPTPKAALGGPLL